MAQSEQDGTVRVGTERQGFEGTNELSKRRRGRAVTGVLFLLFFLGVSDAQMISPLLPLMAKEFGGPIGAVGKLIGSVYAVAAAAAALLVGPLSDRYGRRRFLEIAAVIFTLSLLLVGFTSNLRWLSILRIFTGFAAGIFSTCAIAYVGDSFSYEKRGAAMSAVQSGYFAAFVVGVPLSAVVADKFGWRAAFVGFGVLAAPVIFFTRLLLPDDRLREVNPRVSNQFTRAGALLTNRATVAAVFAASFVSLGFVGFIQYLGSWLAEPNGFGLKVSEVGLVFIGVGMAALFGSAAAIYLSDKVGKRRLSLASTVLLASMLLAIPKFEFGILLFVLFGAASFTFAFRQGPLHALATELVSNKRRGALVAMRNTASQAGIALAAIICGQLYDVYGYTAVGLFSAITTLIAAFCIMMMPEPVNESLLKKQSHL
ncbi:MAG: MFS transporter [Acidobacteriota bacterium]|nr:MFS transporter [Acidobacteriota bacterium]